MKICIICSGFSYVYGGVETAIFKLSEYWVKSGYEVIVLSGRGKKLGPKGVKVIKLPFFQAKYFRKIPFLTKIFPASEFEGLSLFPFALFSLLVVDPDVVLSNQLSETLPALIFRAHSVMISQAPIRTRFKVFNRVDKLIVNDIQSYNMLKKLGFRTELILNGVDKSNFSPLNLRDLRIKLKILPSSIVILTVARLDANKRIKLLIDAFQLISQDVTLLIVGEGPELSSLKKQASQNKSKNRILFLKPLAHEQLKEFYQLCDVFTLPSKLEAMPLVLLEALSFGKTVVTNPTPEKKFILGKFGVFSNVENAHEYSESLLRASSKRIDIESSDYLLHMQKFNWNAIASQYEDVFREVLRKRYQRKIQ